MRVNEENEKAGLKLSIQKTKIMAFGPITSQQIRGKVGTVIDFLFLGYKITANGDCSHEIKRRLLLGTKALTPWKKSSDTSRQRIKKQRHHFGDKGPYSQSYGFPSGHVQT